MMVIFAFNELRNYNNLKVDVVQTLTLKSFKSSHPEVFLGKYVLKNTANLMENTFLTLSK